MMASLVRVVNGPARFQAAMLVRSMSTLDVLMPGWGVGMGRGGGAGGSVRASGGAFGLREAAFEEEYFKRVTEEQLKHLHDHVAEEIVYLQKQVKEMEANIEVKKKRLHQLQTHMTA